MNVIQYRRPFTTAEKTKLGTVAAMLNQIET